MYLILEHTSLAQYGMSHLAKGMSRASLPFNVGIAFIAVAIAI